MSRQYSFMDNILGQADRAMRTLSRAANKAGRPSPAENCAPTELSEENRKHSAGLMRIDHTGEVCAQALYQGQALTAKLSDVRESMEQAAQEEVDHLAWCEERLDQLNAAPSMFNPAWYAVSFAIGALAGIAGDKWSLGFVAETENQVCRHLEDHLDTISEEDLPSRAILEKMKEDEQGHATAAMDAGGVDLPLPVRLGMQASSKVMTSTVYYL
ncbi:MAG: 2-polyprenyl-3-methyl-6-methoxy-1,4-benzoquinone monooxygenase [Gammaproteobacteria bacterium]|nr:2-polyprenyl-3-methyl-6-methoxy-1,4-benzoquinone monooxygenase [Gammaproteobacteria bacterium]